MAMKKSLTKSNLISVLKEFGVATKNDLIHFATKDDLKALATKIDVEQSILKSERRMVKRMNIIKREVMSGMAKLSLSTPTRGEFERLKARVEGIHN